MDRHVPVCRMYSYAYASLVVAGLLFGLFAGKRLFARTDGMQPLVRYAAALLPMVIAVIAGQWIAEWLLAPHLIWNGARLAPSFGLLHGFRLYYGPDAGPVSGHIYGPVSVLLCLPATLFNTPSSAIRAACFISTAFFFLPAFWFIKMAFTRDGRSDPAWISGAVAFALCVPMSRPLTYSAHWLHADAFALGLGALSLTLFPKESDSAKWTSWIPAACCASLSVWSKQTMAPLFVALPLAVAISHGRPAAMRSLSALVVVGTLISALMFGIFGPRETWFNLVTIPSHHPWVADLAKDPRLVIAGSDIGARLHVLGQSLGALLMESLIPLLMLAASLLVKRFLVKGMVSSTRDSLGRWVTPLIVAVLMASTAGLGRVKVGGDVNAFSYSVYFTVLSAAIAIAACFRAACSLDLRPVGRRVHQVILVTMMAGMTVLWVQTAGQIGEQAGKGPSPFDEAADLIRQSPGEVYFPWNPLAHLMAEGKFRHFYYGVYDRELAGFRLGEEHFGSHVPEKLKLIVFHAHADSSILARFPGFHKSVRQEGRTGLVFYERTGQQPDSGSK